jgi:hypothetical protein
MVFPCPSSSTSLFRPSDRSAGQASLEFLGAMPVLVFVGLLVLQAFLVGVTTFVARGAATDAARDATREPAVPGLFRSEHMVSHHGDQVRVTLRAPRVLPGVSLNVSASTKMVGHL